MRDRGRCGGGEDWGDWLLGRARTGCDVIPVWGWGVIIGME